MNSISSKFVQYTHRDKQLQFGSFKMSHGALSKWKIVYKRQICFLEVCLQKSLLTKEYIELFYVGSCLRFKHHMEKWCHMKKCTFKHLQKLNENVGIVTITLQKRTTITGIVRTFTQNKFPIRNLSQSSAHD